jgi:hypothetical protein
MHISDVRQDLEAIRASAQAGDLDGVIHHAAHALGTLDDTQLLTTTEAAAVNTLKLLIRHNTIPYTMHGNRMMLSLATIQQLQDSHEIQGVRASDAAHDAMEHAGITEGLSATQLEDLAASRPGQLPWNTEDA